MEAAVKQCGYETWEELHKNMSPSHYAKRMGPDKVIQHHIDFVAKASMEAQALLTCELDVAYGSGDQKLDFYYPKSIPKDKNEDVKVVFIFIHGGYWQALGKEHGGQMAIPLSKADIVTVSVGYDLAPKVTMTEIVEECCEAVVFVARKFPNAVLVVGGHSCGASMASYFLYVDWIQYGIQCCPLKGVVLLDGIYNLAPFKLCGDNEAVQVTDLEVSKFSTKMLKSPKVRAGFPVLIITGENSTPEFVMQNREYHEVLMKLGIDASFLYLADHDHFSMVNVLSEENNFLTQVLIGFIKCTESKH